MWYFKPLRIRFIQNIFSQVGVLLFATQELTDRLKMPSDAELMQIAIDDLNNSSLPLEDHHRALQELLILVEPIDNANGKYELADLSLYDWSRIWGRVHVFLVF